MRAHLDKRNGLITIDGVTFSLEALAEFLRHIPEEGRVGPVMLERRHGTLRVIQVDQADLVLLRSPAPPLGVTH